VVITIRDRLHFTVKLFEAEQLLRELRAGLEGKGQI
jgi:hypothetical protein